jgi:hypothetical protein
LSYRLFYSPDTLVDSIIASWEKFEVRAAKHPELFPRFKYRLYGFVQYWVGCWPLDFDGPIRGKLISFISSHFGETEANTLKWLFFKVHVKYVAATRES